MARDTSPVAAELQIDVQRRLGGAGRLRLALEMSDLARELTRTRLRTAHPDWSERRLSLELARYALLPLPLPEALNECC